MDYNLGVETILASSEGPNLVHHVKFGGVVDGMTLGCPFIVRKTGAVLCHTPLRSTPGGAELIKWQIFFLQILVTSEKVDVIGMNLCRSREPSLVGWIGVVGPILSRGSHTCIESCQAGRRYALQTGQPLNHADCPLALGRGSHLCMVVVAVAVARRPRTE